MSLFTGLSLQVWTPVFAILHGTLLTLGLAWAGGERPNLTRYASVGMPGRRDDGPMLSRMAVRLTRERGTWRPCAHGGCAPATDKDVIATSPKSL
jgi:hypothetical protein